MADDPRAPLGETDPPAGDEAPREIAETEPALPAEPATVGTGSYLAVSCVAGMALLLLLLIAGLLLSRWLS